MASFGKRMQEARKNLGLNQQELADQIGVTRGAISQWETGRMKPSEKNLRLLEAYLGDFVPEPIGDWLREVRHSKNMTMAELATKSKLSIPTISNIENGHNENPRDDTIRKLERALKAKVPSDVIEVVNQDSEIEDVGRLANFEPHEVDDWPKVAGIYVLYDKNRRPVYIGESDNIERRMNSHKEKFWFREELVKYASFVQIDDRVLRRKVERTAIGLLDSYLLFNKQHTGRFEPIEGREE